MNADSATLREIIRLPNRVDMIISPFFAEDLKQKIRPGVTLILDMARTTFVDPATTPVFLEGILRSQQEGATIVVKGMSAQVSQVFERAGLLPYLG
ncbi:MAG: STAS domain-containing protein [Cyanobacteria bacterium P01_D01_bin.44]